jgi:peptide-methionine (S)-S-oxide reductase
MNMLPKSEVAMFGGGCFWCTEAVLKQLKGVLEVTPGYAGGHTKNPTYGQVSSGKTGHAEVVKIEFDPRVISYRDLLAVFFASHDPTTPNQQGADIGTQYRSIILTTTEEQRQQAEDFIQEINTSEMEGDEVVTEVKSLENFYEAEEEHKDFYDRNQAYGYSMAVISPKLKKVREKFKDLIKDKL